MFSALCPWSYGAHVDQLSQQIFKLCDKDNDNLVNFKVSEFSFFLSTEWVRKRWSNLPLPKNSHIHPNR